MEISILDIISRIEKDQKELGITLYPKASENEILYFERKIGRKLPYDVRLFYSFANGFESDENMFRIIPLEEIIEHCRGVEILDDNDFQFAEYLVFCDYWILAIDTKDSGKYGIYNNTDVIVKLTDSFSEFLNAFLEGGVFEVGGIYDLHEKNDPL